MNPISLRTAPSAETLPAHAHERDLAHLRDLIDRVDLSLVDLIAERVHVARDLAPLKQARGLPLRDTRREAEVLRRVTERARERGVDPEPVRQVFWTLFALASDAQRSATR